MQLISETADTGGPETTKFPPQHATPQGADLGLLSFADGPPHATFASLRAASPVAWMPSSTSDGGAWALTRYADVMQVDGDPETFSSQRGGILMSGGPPETRHPMLYRASLDAMISMDAPNHMQLRKEHMPFFTVRYIETLKAKVAAEVDRLLDGMAGLGQCDLVETLSSRLRCSPCAKSSACPRRTGRSSCAGCTISR